MRSHARQHIYREGSENPPGERHQGGDFLGPGDFEGEQGEPSGTALGNFSQRRDRVPGGLPFKYTKLLIKPVL